MQHSMRKDVVQQNAQSVDVNHFQILIILDFS